MLNMSYLSISFRCILIYLLCISLLVNSNILPSKSFEINMPSSYCGVKDKMISSAIIDSGISDTMEIDCLIRLNFLIDPLTHVIYITLNIVINI